jgi:starch phosphorylase
MTKPQDKSASGQPEPVPFPDALYAEHLTLDHVVSPEGATAADRYEAVARTLRDIITPRWLSTERAREKSGVKLAYSLSMEFLIGRMLANNITNLFARPGWAAFCKRHGLDPLEILEQEPEPGLGNGGLGRLAACMLDSMATLGVPGMGYGLRYREGSFRQTLRDGAQVEQPDHWLAQGDPWEVARPSESVEVRLGCSFNIERGVLRLDPGRTMVLNGAAYDRPIVGFGGSPINTLRLWAATSNAVDIARFSRGDFVGAQIDPITAETITLVLYPDDQSVSGRALRFLQEYFLVACSLADIVRRFRRSGSDWLALPDKVAIQLNDTHPTLAVPELMRILLDEAGLGWELAWDLTRRSLAFTNHTLLPEALESWPVRWFELFLPRHLEIIYEINQRFLDDVRRSHPGDEALVSRVSLIEEAPKRRVRMAHLGVVGSHSTNGVAAIHGELLKRRVMPDLAALFPERFHSITNGISQRRFLLVANPTLAEVITGAIGEQWIVNLQGFSSLASLADDSSFRAGIARAKRQAKLNFTDWLRKTTGQQVDPDTIFDAQVKRIHEYKRQLLNALRIVILYQRLRQNPGLEFPRRTCVFAGKAAPGYQVAKLIIRFLNGLGETLAREPSVRDRLAVVFVPDYSVSVAERVIPASDISEQISTAGFEASGTSNMKFMMNGALTVGTRDGATIEMAGVVGEENLFLFGLSAQQVEESRSWYEPRWHYENEPETRDALDLIASGHFSPEEPGLFAPLVDLLLRDGDYYRHLADLRSYCAVQEDAGRLYTDQAAWTRRAILNIAGAGPFSSDRTVMEYARRIWGVTATAQNYFSVPTDRGDGI